MLIQIMAVGPIRTNCYIIADEKTKEALIIDPGAEPDRILGKIKELGLKPFYIAITHGHWDHVGAISDLKQFLNIPMLLHELDIVMLPVTRSAHPDKLLKDKDQIKVGSLIFTIIHTPGHTPGGICLYLEKEKVLFSGDTLFYHDSGRTDLPLSSEKEMVDSLKKLMELPDETKVYPGHGPATSINEERKLIG